MYPYIFLLPDLVDYVFLPLVFLLVFGYTGNVKHFNTDRQVEETWNDRGSDGRASFMNEYATRINLHEHEDDEKGNGLCNVIASYAACAYRKGN